MTTQKIKWTETNAEEFQKILPKLEDGFYIVKYRPAKFVWFGVHHCCFKVSDGRLQDAENLVMNDKLAAFAKIA